MNRMIKGIFCLALLLLAMDGLWPQGNAYCAQRDFDAYISNLRANGKLHDPDKILSDFINGKDETTVIVFLQPTAAAKALTDQSKLSEQIPAEFTVRGAPTYYKLQDESIKRQLKATVTETVDRFIERLGAIGIKVTQRFSYQFGFAALVTPAALEQIVNWPDVVTIEKDSILQAHLAQGIPLMNASTVRSIYRGSGLSIAICDTGIDTSHPRLGGGGFPNSKVIGGYDVGDNDADPRPNSTSGHPHGTCCAGIAAGDTGTVGDYIGGVASDAKLYAVKISYGNTGSAYTSAMIAGWEWVITHKDDNPSYPIMIISTSFGGDQYYSTCDSASTGMTTAAANAVAAGITIFASSGNDGYCDSMAWPACISYVNSVGAVYDTSFGIYQPCVNSASCASKIATIGCATGYYANDNSAADKVTSYSNSASFLTLFAPSNMAYTTDIVGAGGYASGDYYDSFGGTSAACPYAAGAAAVLQQAAKAKTGSYLTPAQVKTYLVNNGDLITDGKVAITKPRINLGKAVDAIMAAPTATTNAASGVTSSGATLNGTVNAKNGSTTVTFQYGLNTAYGSTVTADQSPVTGNINTAVSKAIIGLTPNTTYHFQVVGVNSAGTTNGGDLTFTTTAAAPTATTNAASGVTSSSATLNGMVNPNGSATIYYFQWGTTISYGNNTSSQSAGSGTSNVAVSANINQLGQHTAYHYRLIATNSEGTSYGSDGTLTTLSIYQVTPSIGFGTGHGTITPDTAQAVDQGSTTAFTVTPDSGYTASVGGTCGGTLVGTTYTTNPVTANCSVIADFTSTATCQSQPVRIVRTNTAYNTLQEAYDVAQDNDTIQAQALTLIQNLTVNRNILVTLSGGYPCNYGSNSGNMTTLKGWIRTLAGGGTLTIGNFIVMPNVQPPTVTTGSATNVTSNSATINGTVKPNSAETTYYFEWGLTTAYGTTNPLTPASVGSGTNDVPVSANLTGLTPNTIYHYRLVAINSEGTTNGLDGTFTTPCVYTVSPTTDIIISSSGTRNIQVTTSSGCSWTAVRNDAWISIDSGASGTGGGTVQYSVTANPSKDSRTGTMTIAGQIVTVEQAGAPCSYALNPMDQSFTAWGGTGSVAVTAVSGCTWSGVSNVNWITITSGASGTGNGTLNFNVSANSGAGSRSGTMAIAGTTFTVNQAAGPLTCGGLVVKNKDTGATYANLQDAYNAASNGQTLQTQCVTLTGDLTVNRNIAVTLEGGYSCDFSADAGIMTKLQGWIKTTSGGGTLTIKNFELDY